MTKSVRMKKVRKGSVGGYMLTDAEMGRMIAEATVTVTAPGRVPQYVQVNSLENGKKRKQASYAD
jgi:hypothetical protein